MVISMTWLGCRCGVAAAVTGADDGSYSAGVLSQDLTEMPLAEDQHMIKALAMQGWLSGLQEGDDGKDAPMGVQGGRDS